MLGLLLLVSMTWIISVGYAGACYVDLARAEVVESEPRVAEVRVSSRHCFHRAISLRHFFSL